MTRSAGRSPSTLAWYEDDAEPNADMWATADESREDIVGLYRRVWAHSDVTIDTLELDARGRVPWWGEHGEVTLHQILVHMLAETDRHAGHADIVRELIDGAAGCASTTTTCPAATGRGGTTTATGSNVWPVRPALRNRQPAVVLLVHVQVSVRLELGRSARHRVV